MPVSQKTLVWNFIIGKQKVTTNDLRSFGASMFIADPEKRARELYQEGKLGRRDITEQEMADKGLKTKISVYFVKTETPLCI